MADPISISSLVLPVVTSTASVILELYDALEQISTTTERLIDLAEEVKSLDLVLQALQSVLEKESFINLALPTSNAKIWKSLVTSMVELQDLVHDMRHTIGSDAAKRGYSLWLRLKQGRIDRYRGSIQQRHLSLQTTLAVLQLDQIFDRPSRDLNTINSEAENLVSRALPSEDLTDLRDSLQAMRSPSDALPSASSASQALEKNISSLLGHEGLEIAAPSLRSRNVDFGTEARAHSGTLRSNGKRLESRVSKAPESLLEIPSRKQPRSTQVAHKPGNSHSNVENQDHRLPRSVITDYSASASQKLADIPSSIERATSPRPSDRDEYSGEDCCRGFCRCLCGFLEMISGILLAMIYYFTIQQDVVSGFLIYRLALAVITAIWGATRLCGCCNPHQFLRHIGTVAFW